MATNDVTAMLITMIEQGFGANQDYATNSMVFSTTTDVVSSVANWVQILGTAEGPLAQDDVIQTIGQIATAQAQGTLTVGAAEEAAAAGSAAISAGVGAALVLLVALLLSLTAEDNDTSVQVQEYEALNSAIQALGQDAIATYWQGEMNYVFEYWDPMGPYGLKVFLTDLAAQGTGGNHVQTEVSLWHGAAFSFIYAIADNPTCWQVPAEPPATPLVFGAGAVPQSTFTPSAPWWNGGPGGWAQASWYGQFPQRLPAGGVPNVYVTDPRTFLPQFALAIHSDLILESLANLVDSSQPTLDEFLSQYGWTFFSPPPPGSNQPSGFLPFLYQQYQLAVSGIVKTDIPTRDEILGFLWVAAFYGAGIRASPDTDPNLSPGDSWGAPDRDRGSVAPAFSGDGYCWTGLVGAAETYPLYGRYPEPASNVPNWPWGGSPGPNFVYSPAYIVSYVSFPGGSAANAMAEWQRTGILFTGGSNWYVSMAALDEWVIPWLENKMIIGRMARWKAIYLLNSYDQIWEFLQGLQQVIQPTPPVAPSTMTVQDQDGIAYIADGNWSARELIGVVRISTQLLQNYGVQGPGEFWNPQQPFDWQPDTYVLVSPAVSVYSLSALAGVLYNVANGDWGGPPPWAEGLLPPPFSLRGVLATIAT